MCMRRRIHVYEVWIVTCMSCKVADEEEDTCHVRRRIHVYEVWIVTCISNTCISYEVSYQEEDTCV